MVYARFSPAPSAGGMLRYPDSALAAPTRREP